MEAINIFCYVSNRVFLRLILHKTPYELWFEHKPNILYCCVFGSKCIILNTKDNLRKLDSKSNKGIFLGFSYTRKAYRIYNHRTLLIEESMYVVLDESNHFGPKK